MMLSTLRLSNIFLSAISFQDDIDYIGKIIKTEGLVLIIGAGPFFVTTQHPYRKLLVNKA